MAAWTFRRDGERILEPSAGDGIFLRALQTVAAAREWTGYIHAVECDESAYQLTRTTRFANLQVDVKHNDFMLHTAPKVDAVVGNPPYVRVRHLDAASRAASLACAARYLAEPMDPAGSTWMPFILHACESLVTGGRLAFVLPYEMTYVKYALPLWEFLGRSFGTLRVIRVHERLFPGLLQEVVILLADNKGSETSSVEFDAFETVADLTADSPLTRASLRIEEVGSNRPFVTALLDPHMRDIRERLIPFTLPAEDVAAFRIGYVSGDKNFFQPSPSEIDRFQIPETSLRSAVASGRKLRGQGLWTSELTNSQPLFLPDANNLTKGDLGYIRHGEELAVNERYKCRIREPWYVVPGVKVPDALLTVFSEIPLLMGNDAARVASNSLICAYLRPDKDLGDFIGQWYTSVTLLSIEEEVHSLGGGVFVLVPKEASRIRIAHNKHTSSGNHKRINECLRRGDARSAYRVGDDSLVSSGVLDKDELGILHASIERLSYWRTSSRYKR